MGNPRSAQAGDSALDTHARAGEAPLAQSSSTRSWRILVIRPDRIGDVVLTTPLLRALRRALPSAHLGALVRPYARAVLEGSPHLDCIVEDDPEGRDRGLGGFWSLVRRVRSERFDTSLMVLPTRRYAVLTLLAGIPRRIGVGRKPYEVLTGTRPAGRNRDRPVRHEADYCLDLARAIGVESSDLRPEVFLTAEERNAGRRRIGRMQGMSGIVACVHPGSGGSAPNWDPGRYATLSERLVRDLGARVVVTGRPGEAGMGTAIRERLGSGLLDLTGQLSVRELMGVIGACDVLVSSSTGSMHLAGALGIPCVSLFCPRTACCPTRWGPLGEGHRVLLADSGRCRACGAVRDPECALEEISVEDALQAVREVAGQGPPKGLAGEDPLWYTTNEGIHDNG